MRKELRRDSTNKNKTFLTTFFVREIIIIRIIYCRKTLSRLLAFFRIQTVNKFRLQTEDKSSLWQQPHAEVWMEDPQRPQRLVRGRWETLGPRRNEAENPFRHRPNCPTHRRKLESRRKHHQVLIVTVFFVRPLVCPLNKGTQLSSTLSNFSFARGAMI